MIYAPITLVTLNRYEHLVRCIDSLKKNADARYTELYISVDYPPTEKYTKGYNKIVEYLKQGLDGFKQVFVFFQKENLGEFDNIDFIKRKAYEKHDRLIFLEDDNEVAPNFLSFCNKGLDCFEGSPDVLYINGTNYVWCGKGFEPKKKGINDKDSKVHKRQVLWHGYATWKYVDDTMKKICVDEYLDYGKDYRKMKKLYDKSKFFFYAYIRDVLLSRKKRLPWVKGAIYPIDSVINVYLLINDKFVVAPQENLIKDWGMDGSGLNFKKVAFNCHLIVGTKLSSDEVFDFPSKDEIDIDDTELEKHDKFGLPAAYKRGAFIVGLLLYKLNIIRS